MSTLLLQNIDTLATFDEERRVLKNACILVKDHLIDSIGTGKYDGQPVETSLDLSGYVVLPGLVNLHHHYVCHRAKDDGQLESVPQHAQAAHRGSDDDCPQSGATNS